MGSNSDLYTLKKAKRAEKDAPSISLNKLKKHLKVFKRGNQFYDTTRFGYPEIRVYHKAGKAKRSSRYLLKCGCCNEKLEIYYADDGLEIGGINGAIEDWREILLPLLLIEVRGEKLVDKRKRKK